MNAITKMFWRQNTPGKASIYDDIQRLVWIFAQIQDWNNSLSEKLACLEVQLRAPLKPLNTIECCDAWEGGVHPQIRPPWCLERRRISLGQLCAWSSIFFSRPVYTQKSFWNLIKSNLIQIVYTVFRLIWIQTNVRWVPNQSVQGKYNMISVW